MDFHGLKRKQLQSLCKKHGFLANLKNSEMADRLSALFNEEKKSKRGRSCMKDLSVVNEEEIVGSKEAKKVKFSPQNETFVFEKTDPREVRLLARTKRGFRKPEIEENPGCRIEGIVQNDGVLENVVEKNLRRRRRGVVDDSGCRIDDNAAKGGGRSLRRKSVVEKVVGSEVGDHGEEDVKRVLRRRTIVVKSDANVVSRIVDDVDKPVGKGLRERTVVEADSILDLKNEGDDVVEKGGGRNLRRKSVVGKGLTVVGAEIENAGARISRRKSVVGKGRNVAGVETEGEVEKAGERISRRKSVVGKGAAVLESVKGVNGDNVERQCTEREDLEQNVRCRGKKTKQVSVQNLLLSPCVEKAKTSRKDQGVVGEVAAAEVNRPPDKMVTRRQLRSRAVVAEVSGKGDDNNIGVSGRDTLAERQEKIVKATACVTAADEHKDEHVLVQVVEENGQEVSPVVPKNRKAKNGGKKPVVLKKQEVKGGKDVGVEDLGEAKDADNEISENKGWKRQGLRKTKTNVGPKVMEVVRKSSRQKVMSMVEASSSEQVVDDTKGHQSMDVLDLDVNEMEAQHVNEQEVVAHSTVTPAAVHDKETITSGSALPKILSDCREYTIDEYSATEYSVSTNSVKKKVANLEAATEISPKNAEKLNNSMPLEHFKEETDSLYRSCGNALPAVQTPIIDSSVFKNSGDRDGEAESVMTADKIPETFSNLNSAGDRNSCEEAALSPPTNHNIQLCTTLLGSNAEQNFVGESVCHSTVKPSIPERSGFSDVCMQQPSNSLSEIKDERNSETFESSEGLECNGQSRNEQLIQPESWSEETPCLSSSQLTDNEVEDKDKLIDDADVTVDGSDTNGQSPQPESWCEESLCRSSSPPNDDVQNKSIDCAAVIVEESDANDQSKVEQLTQPESWCEESPCLKSSPLNVNVVEDKLVDCAAMIVEESDVNDQSTNEQLTQPEHWCKETPCLRASPSIDNVVVDESIDCAAVIVEELDVQLNEQDEAARLWDSYGSIIRANAVLDPEASVAANVQSPVIMEAPAVSSNASPAALENFMEECNDIDTVTSLKKDSSSSKAEDFQHPESPFKGDTEARTEPSSPINTSSLYLQSEIDGSLDKGSDDKETPDRTCVESCIQVNNFAEESNFEIVNQLDQMNVKLEGVKDDPSNSNVKEELPFEKADSLMNQDALGLTIGEEISVLFQERECSLVNISADVFGSTSHQTFESISVSDKAKCLEKRILDAAETLKSDISFFKNISASYVKFEDRELPEASLSASVLSPSDFGSTCIKFSGHNNLTIDTDKAAEKLEFHLNDASKSADWNSISQKEDIHHQLDNHCDKYVAQTCKLTVLFGSDDEGSHKETQNTNHTCFGNDGNSENVDENIKCIAGMQQEEVNCFNDSEFEQHLASENYKDNTDAQSKDLESENIDWTSEYLLALDGEVEESVLFQERKSADLVYEQSTLHFGVHSSIVPDTTMDFECRAVKEDDPCIDGVNNLDTENEEPAETSNSEIAQLSSKLESKSVLNKQLIVPETSLMDDESSVNHQSNSCLIIAEANENQTPEISCAANFSSETDNTFTAQEYSVEKKEDSSSGGPCGKSGMRNSGNFLLTDAASALIIGMKSSVVTSVPSMYDSATHEVASASQHFSEEYECNETLQNACISDVEGAHLGKAIFSNGDKYNEVKSGDMVEPDAEISEVFHSESATPDDTTQALVCEMDDGPKTVAGEKLADDAGATEMELQGLSCSPFSFVNRKIDGANCSCEADVAETKDDICSATVEIRSFGEDNKGASDIGASEYAIEVQTYNQLNDTNGAGQENVNEKPEKDASGNRNDDSASSRLLPFDFGEVSEVQVDEDNCMPGEQIINQEHADGNMDSIGQEFFMMDQHHLAMEKPDNLESVPRVNHLIDTSLDQIVHNKSISPDAKHDITNLGRASNPPMCKNNEMTFNSSEERVIEGSVGDIIPKSMEEHEVDSGIAILFNDDQDNGGEMVGPSAENSEVCPSESAVPDNIIPEALFHEMDNEPQSNAEKNLTSSPYSAAKENTEADTAELRDNINSSMEESYPFGENETRVSDVKEALESVPKVQPDNHLNATDMAGQENVYKEQVDNDGSKRCVDSTSISDDFLASDLDDTRDGNTNGVLKKSIELEFDAEGNCMFGEQILNQEQASRNMDSIDKDACMTEEAHSALERRGYLGCSPCADDLMYSAPEDILPSKSRSPEGEDVGRASNPPVYEHDGVILGASEENAVDCSVGDIVTFSKSMEHDEVDAEHLFEPSVTMIDREGNDSDLSDNKAVASASSLYVAENVTDQLQEQSHAPLLPSYQHMEPTEESARQIGTIIAARFEKESTKSNIVFTSSEIERLSEKITDDIQTEATDTTNYVNLMDFTNVDCTVNTNESDEKIQEPEDSALGEQDQLRDVVGDVQNCNDDKRNANSERVSERKEDLDADDKSLMSSMVLRKNTRSVLIHGTPKRLPAFKHDMKENTPAQKTLPMADATALKPSLRRRKALDDIGR